MIYSWFTWKFTTKYGDFPVRKLWVYCRVQVDFHQPGDALIWESRLIQRAGWTLMYPFLKVSAGTWPSKPGKLPTVWEFHPCSMAAAYIRQLRPRSNQWPNPLVRLRVHLQKNRHMGHHDGYGSENRVYIPILPMVDHHFPVHGHLLRSPMVFKTPFPDRSRSDSIGFHRIP